MSNIHGDFLLDEIKIGEECEGVLDPSCIRFSYLIAGEIPEYDDDGDLVPDGETHFGIQKIIHRYKQIQEHSVESFELTNEADIQRAHVGLLGQELSNLVYILVQLNDYQFEEIVVDELVSLINSGYEIINQHDLEMGGEDEFD